MRTAQPINFKNVNHNKEKWIFEDSSEVGEAYDQQVGGHISQKDMTCMWLEIITRMKIKTMGLQDFRVYYFFRYKISENLHYTTIPASSFVLINRMCSIVFLKIIIRKNLSGFQTSASSRSPRKHNSILNTPLPINCSTCRCRPLDAGELEASKVDFLKGVADAGAEFARL